MAKRFEFENDLLLRDDHFGLEGEPEVAFDFGPRLNTQDFKVFPDFTDYNLFPAFESKTSPVSATTPAAVFELSSLLAANGGNGSAGFVINGVNPGDRSGYSISNLGDINGDGFDDIIIGATEAGPYASASGASYIVFGSNAGFSASFELSGLDGTNGFVVNGVGTNDRSGGSVSAAGDINGDGFDDIIIGASSGDPNGSQSGESYVIFGTDAGFAASLELSALNGANGFTINGIDADDMSGGSVASAGDINGDGFDDFLIGATEADSDVMNSGEIYVIFGRDDNIPFTATLELSSLDGMNGFVISGIGDFDRAGRSISSAGDINGDGFDDIIIGSSASPNGFLSGQSYVIFGKNSGFGANLDLSTLDGTNGFTVNGVEFGDLSGLSVSSAGDINGDGFDDIIIGARLADPNETDSGESYVIFGKNTGFSATLNLSTLDGDNGFVINGIDFDDRSGQSVSSAGDINGDGFDDIIIGAYSARPNGYSSGESYVIFGRNDGFGSSFDLASLDGTNGFILNGVDRGDFSGRSVSSAGDMNGDGFDDIIIGAYSANANGYGSGETYVIFGRAAFGRDNTLLTPGDDNFTGTEDDDFIFALSGDDVLTTFGGDDELNGNEGNDTLRSGSGNDIVEGDEGNDTILGNAGNDDLSGGDGADLVIGGGGNDTMNGDSGEDQLSGQGGDDVIFGGADEDDILGGSGADEISGGDGVDTINAGGGNDTVNGDAGADNLSAGTGADTVYGGAGDDMVFGNNQNDMLFGDDGGDILDGGAGNDLLDGGDGDDALFGAGSQDTLLGGLGIDLLFGGSGGDNLDGGDGNDTLEGGGGNDTLTGGAGADTFSQTSGFRSDRITDFENGIDLIDFSNNISANSFADVMAAASQSGANVRIELNPNNILILENFDLADLDASDFIF